MFHRALLDNGIRVVAEPVTGVRSVSIGAWICVGSRDESEDVAGISHFLEHMHFKGTARRTAQDIANEIDGLGGELNAFTSRESTTYYVKTLDEHLDLGLDLLGDILTASRFENEDIEREKGPVIEEINMVEDTPDDYIHDLLYSHVWPGAGLGSSILGTRETIGGIRRDALVDFVARNYVPDEIVIAAAGNFSVDRLVGLLNEQFGSVRAVGKRPHRERPAFVKGVRVYPRDLSEVHLCLGFEGLPQSDEDRYALYVLNAILGSGISSRLFQEIREKRGLAYSVFSYLGSHSDTGMVGIYSGTSRERVSEVVDLVLGEIKRFVSEPLPDADLGRAREQLKGNLSLGLESTGSRMSQLARDEISFGRLFTVDDIISGIEGVSTESVARLAGELFSNDRIALVALGPLAEDFFGTTGLPFP